MAHRIRIYRTGGLEVLEYEDCNVSESGTGELRLRGVNNVRVGAVGRSRVRDLHDATKPSQTTSLSHIIPN